LGFSVDAATYTASGTAFTISWNTGMCLAVQSQGYGLYCSVLGWNLKAPENGHQYGNLVVSCTITYNADGTSTSVRNDSVTKYSQLDFTGAACAPTISGTRTSMSFTVPNSEYGNWFHFLNVNGDIDNYFFAGITPSAPQSVTVTGGPGNATISWAAPSSDGGSGLTYYTVSDGNGHGCTVNAPATSCTVAGLSAATSYTFSVVANNRNGASPASSTAIGSTYGPPVAPAAPTVSWPLPGSITVTWSAPTSSGGESITSYTVTGTGNGLSTLSCTTSSYTCTFGGLSNSAAYNFTVVAQTVDFTSPASSSGSAASSFVVPAAPTNVTVAGGNSAATISWTAPNNGLPLTYQVTSSSAQNATSRTCSTTATSCTVTGLTNGVAYVFTVTASNVLGTSSSSSPTSPVTPALIPGAPTIVSVVASDRSVVVTWSAPASNGGATITSYTVTDPAGDSCTGTDPTDSCTVRSLTNGTPYTFTVTATNSTGTGPASFASPSVTPAVLPGAPSAVTATQGNASVSLSWTAPSNGGSLITSYTVTSSSGLTYTVSGGATTLSITGLTNGTSYSFTITATNAIGTGTASTSVSVTPAAPPSAPTVTTTTTGAGSVTVSWTAGSTNGAAITGYSATTTPGSFSCSPSVASGSAVPTSCQITGLTAGTSYTVSVTATNAAGTSNPSVASSPFTPTQAAPSTPVITGVASVSNTSALVSWTAPAANGSAITSYAVKVVNSTTLGCTTATTSCTVTGLTNGSSYTFTVTATNAVGDSPVGSSSPTTVGLGFSLAASNGVYLLPAQLQWDASLNGGIGASEGITYAIVGYGDDGSRFTTASSATSQSISWTTATAPITVTGATALTYQVTAQPGGATCSISATTPGSCTLTALSGSTTYSYLWSETLTSPSSGTSLSVSWRAPTNLLSGQVPAGYVVQVIRNGTVVSSCVTTSLSCTVAGIVASTSYTVSVTPFSGGAIPVQILRMSATNWTATAIPATSSAAAPTVTLGATVAGPTGLTSVVGSRTATLSWISSVGSATPVSYLVVDSGWNNTTNKITYCFTRQTFCTISGLTDGTATSLKVIAVISSSIGWWSGSSSASISVTTSATAPAATLAISSSVTLSSISFTASNSLVSPLFVGQLAVDATGAQLMGVALTTTAAGAWSITPLSTPGAPAGVSAVSTSPTQVTVTWLAPNSNGAAISSYTVTSTPQNSQLDAPSSQTTTSSSTKLTVSWQPITLSAGQVVIGFTLSATATGRPTVSCTTTETSCVLSGLTLSTTYTFAVVESIASQCTTMSLTCSLTVPAGVSNSFTVTATNLMGTSAQSTPTGSIMPSATSSQTVPSPVTAVTTVAGMTSVTVSWTSPVNTYGSTISSYTVSSIASLKDATSHTCSTTTTSCTVIGLTPGFAYSFSVVATNNVGNSTATRSGSVTTGIKVIQAPVAPSAPGAVNVAMGATNYAVISWTAPTSTGGAAITNYLVTSTPGNLQCQTTTTSCTIARLTAGQSYTFRVVAYDIVGPGVAGVSASAVAGTASAGASPVIVPTNTASFFGGAPVPVTGTITCCTATAGALTFGSSFTAAPDSVTLRGVTFSNIHMTWTPTTGWTGTATASLGGSAIAVAGTFAYTDAMNWTFTATSSTGSIYLAPNASKPFASITGAITDVGGSLSWSLSISVGDITLIPGFLSLASITATVASTCPKLSDDVPVCPSGNNAIYLSLSGTLTVTIGTGSVDVTAMLVYGMNSDTMALGASLGDIVIASGVTLTQVDLIAQFNSSLTLASVSTPNVGFAGVPSEPYNVSGSLPDGTGMSTVVWHAPESNGGTPVIGYLVTATAAPGSPAADTPQTCTYIPPLSGPEADTCAITGLDPAVVYTFSVVATNGVGSSPPGVATAYGSISLASGGAHPPSLVVRVFGGLSVPSIGLSMPATFFLTTLDNCGFTSGTHTHCATALISGSTGSTSTTGSTTATTTGTDTCQTGTSPILGVCPLFGWGLLMNLNSSGFNVPNFAASSMGYLSTAGTVNFQGAAMQVGAGSFFFGGYFTLPASVATITGVSSVQAWMQYSPVTQLWLVSAQLGTGWVKKFGTVTVTFVATAITVTGVGPVLTGISVAEGGTVSFVNADGSTATIAATLSAGYADGNMTAQISLYGATPGADAWDNVFGYQGFNLISATMAISIGATGPSLGFAATASLPASLMQAIGGDGSAIISVAGMISETSPCFSFSLSAPAGATNRNVLNIGKGSLTATSVSFMLAPRGCQIGTIGQVGSITMMPGVSLSFSGAFLQVPVTASLSVLLPSLPIGTTPAQPYFSVSGSITVGAFNLGALHMGAGSISVSISDQPGATESFSFSAQATLYGVSIAASASATYVLGTLTGSVAVAGSVNNVTVGGFGVRSFAFSFQAGDVGLPTFAVSLSLLVDVGGGGSGITMSGSVGTTGASLTASSDITLGGFSTHSAFTYAISSTTSGVSVSFTNAMSINLWGTTQSATASYSIGTDGSLWLTETFDASLELAGWHFGGMQVVMVMHGATITYSLSGSISLFSGALTGSITAALRAGSNGGQFVILLNLTADLTAHITGFNGTAKLTIYNCGTPCTSYIAATVGFRFMIGISGTSINVDTGWQTLSASSFSVPVSSAFSSTGSYNTGGFTADGVSCSGIAISMKASGNLVATLSDTGLSNSAAQLSASATISWDGFKVLGVTYGKFSASVSVTVGWDSSGVYVMSAAYDVGSVSIAGTKVWDGYHVGSQKIYVLAW